MSDKFRRDGTPYPAGDRGLFEWAEDMKHLDKRRVAQTQIGPYWVSTVWLGLDHSFGKGPPLIFETMVFINDEFTRNRKTSWFPKEPKSTWNSSAWVEDDARRYSTEAEAIAGHEEICELYRKKSESGDHHLFGEDGGRLILAAAEKKRDRLVPMEIDRAFRFLLRIRKGLHQL